MDHEALKVTRDLNIQRARPGSESARAVKQPASRDTFEALLGKVSRGVEVLKCDAKKTSTLLSSEGLSRPEEFAAALQEAGRNYRSAMNLGKNLIEAYRASMGQEAD